jgi:hypothetical protein
MIAIVLLVAASTNLDYENRSAEKPFKVTMCNGQTTTGVCDSIGDGTGTPIIHRFSGAYTLTLYGTQSTDAYVCDFYSNDTGYDADAADKQKMNSVSIDDSNQSISFAGLFDYGWVECPTVTTSVVVTMLASPL